MIYEEEKIPLRVETKYYACAVLSHEYIYEPLGVELLPLDSDLLKRLSDCEAVALKMMERDEIRGEWSYDKRKEVYLRHLRYWNHVIETEQIKLFVSSNIPHVVYDYIIYCLCRVKGIRTVLFYQFQPGLSFSMSDWKDPTPGIRERIAALSCSGEMALSPRLEHEWQMNVVNRISEIPFYMLTPPNQQINEFSKGRFPFFKSRMKNLLIKPWRLVLFVWNLRQRLNQYYSLLKEHYLLDRSEKINDYYRNLCVSPDLSQKFIYFPLHLQPELSTSPMAGVYVDQLLIAQLMSAYLPEGYYIYVKEHPNQNMLYRSEDFYKTLSSLKSVKIVPRSYDTFKLIDNSFAVATCTGTAGWEAFLKAKSVFLFGYTFYQNAPNVFPVRSKEDFEKALRDILSYPRKEDWTSIRAFLKALDTHAVYGNIDPDYMQNSELSWKQNSSIIIESLKKSLSADYR
ncbi:capsular biosynthesis protein [Leptospira fletcheri]|uniref:Capsular biosynthesis protein n=1 Tax=Leptospira fletcheri TaxID=2484981 RepID=A0A4R9GFY8_9LEPT|nr:capsular biosynthesis protein [Leptospira fletcheri]